MPAPQLVPVSKCFGTVASSDLVQPQLLPLSKRLAFPKLRCIMVKKEAALVKAEPAEVKMEIEDVATAGELVILDDPAQLSKERRKKKQKIYEQNRKNKTRSRKLVTTIMRLQSLYMLHNCGVT